MPHITFLLQVFVEKSQDHFPAYPEHLKTSFPDIIRTPAGLSFFRRPESNEEPGAERINAVL
jgi:hypothetical protein